MTSKSTLQVETPEGIVFSFNLASPLRRALAYTIDFGVIMSLAGGFGKAVQILAAMGTDWASAFSIIASFVISMAYGISLEWNWRGQTLGKRILRLRVVDTQGMRLQFTQVVVRNLLRAIDMLPIFYLTGVVSILASGKAQRLGDMAAATIVTHEPLVASPNLEKIAPAKYNSLLGYPHFAARLRNRIPPEAVSLALKALSVRDSYESFARLALFRDMAEYFRSLVVFPDEAIEGLSDEQYVRSVVHALYTQKAVSIFLTR